MKTVRVARAQDEANRKVRPVTIEIGDPIWGLAETSADAKKLFDALVVALPDGTLRELFAMLRVYARDRGWR